MSIAFKQTLRVFNRIHIPADYFEPTLPAGAYLKLQRMEDVSERSRDHDDFFGPFMPPFVPA